MRIAVITHSFPPSTHSNAKRPYYIVKALADDGWEVDVFTSPLACPADYGEILVHPSVCIRRIADPVERFRARFARFRRLYRGLTIALSAVLWPDQYFAWVKTVYRRFLRPERYDRILVFVFPPSVYLGNDLVDGKWAFDLQESVTPQFRKVPRRSPLQRWRTPRLAAMESKALHAAGDVIFTAGTNRKAYIEAGLVPAERAKHFPYFYDADFFELDAPETASDFSINYFGNFDLRGSRSPEVFLEALSVFLEKYPGARTLTRFVFRGGWLPEHFEIVRRLSLEDVVDIRKAVPYENYLSLLRKSPVLLLVVAPEHNLFMPSKVVDYFGSGRPVLALVPRDSEMRSILEEADMTGFAADHNDVGQCVAALERLWRNFEEHGLMEVSGRVKKWSSDTLLPSYLKMLRGQS